MNISNDSIPNTHGSAATVEKEVPSNSAAACSCCSCGICQCVDCKCCACSNCGCAA